MTTKPGEKPIDVSYWDLSVNEPTVRCKHGRVFACLICGVTDRRDANHRTTAGVGEVGRLIGKRTDR